MSRWVGSESDLRAWFLPRSTTDAEIERIYGVWEGPPGKELSDEEMFQRIEKEIEKMENEAIEVQLAASKYQRIAHMEDFHSAFPEFSTLAKGQKVRIVEVADDSGEKTGSVIARTVAEKSQAPEGVDPIVGFVKG